MAAVSTKECASRTKLEANKRLGAPTHQRILPIREICETTKAILDRNPRRKVRRQAICDLTGCVLEVVEPLIGSSCTGRS